MTNKISLLVFLVVIGYGAMAQSEQKGPYTVEVLTEGVYHIEDANDSNPAGMHVEKDGTTSGMNNCSDMYLVVGNSKAMLIDLSNAIEQLVIHGGHSWQRGQLEKLTAQYVYDMQTLIERM